MVRAVHPPRALPSPLVPLEDLAVTVVTAPVATNLVALVLAPLVLPHLEASVVVSLVLSPLAASSEPVARARARALSLLALPSPLADLADLAVNRVPPPLVPPSQVVASVVLAASEVVRPAL